MNFFKIERFFQLTFYGDSHLISNIYIFLILKSVLSFSWWCSLPVSCWPKPLTNMTLAGVSLWIITRLHFCFGADFCSGWNLFVSGQLLGPGKYLNSLWQNLGSKIFHHQNNFSSCMLLSFPVNYRDFRNAVWSFLTLLPKCYWNHFFLTNAMHFC